MDPCLYLIVRQDGLVILGVYVEDIILAADYKTQQSNRCDKLCAELTRSYIVSLSYLSRMEVKTNGKTIMLTKKLYCSKHITK
jgi:hypothetical protein